MKIKLLLLIAVGLIGINFSCSTETENIGNNNCTVNANTLKKFLFEERNTVIEIFGSNKIDIKDDCPDIEAFIKNYRVDKNRKRIYNDTLIQFLGLPVFDDFIEREDNKRSAAIIRLQKSNENQILVIQGRHGLEGITIWAYNIEFDKNCIDLTKKKSVGEPFNGKCFKLVDYSKKDVIYENWTELYELIIDTNLVNTSYTEDITSWFCLGDSYFLEYFSGSGTHYINRKYEYDCPSSKSGVFLVSEKLIEISEALN